MAGPIEATGPCPHGVVDDICEPCTLRNLLAALVEVCDDVRFFGDQVEDAREFVRQGAVQASPSVSGFHPLAAVLDDLVKVAGHMVARHYQTPEGIVGGMLHVQLDDDNIEDCFWEDPFSQEVQDIWERGPTGLERDIAGIMKALPYEYRDAVLLDAKERGTWDDGG
jgi:hypothetical protein